MGLRHATTEYAFEIEGTPANDSNCDINRSSVPNTPPPPRPQHNSRIANAAEEKTSGFESSNPRRTSDTAPTSTTAETHIPAHVLPSGNSCGSSVATLSGACPNLRADLNTLANKRYPNARCPGTDDTHNCRASNNVYSGSSHSSIDVDAAMFGLLNNPPVRTKSRSVGAGILPS